MISERQKDILNELIREYIKTAKPVSSDLLEKKGFDCCPATIRVEMKKLADLGYLNQPHTSGGRVPTNKAYRFFVDNVVKTENKNSGAGKNYGEAMAGEFEKIKEFHNERMKVAESIAKSIAYFTHGLVFARLSGDDFTYKEGWREVFKNPEFEEKGVINEFLDTVDRFEENIKMFENDSKITEQPTVYIGKEGSVLDSGDFSLVVSRGVFPEDSEAIFAILGPTRMPYDKNISLINSLIAEFEKF